MPVPKPNENEKQDAFMARCMQMMTKENESKPKDKKRPQKQMVAICMSQFRGGKSMAGVMTSDEEKDFREKFLAKYPEYKPYFVEENNDGQE